MSEKNNLQQRSFRELVIRGNSGMGRTLKSAGVECPIASSRRCRKTSMFRAKYSSLQDAELLLPAHFSTRRDIDLWSQQPATILLANWMQRTTKMDGRNSPACSTTAARTQSAYYNLLVTRLSTQSPVTTDQLIPRSNTKMMVLHRQYLEDHTPDPQSRHS